MRKGIRGVGIYLAGLGSGLLLAAAAPVLAGRETVPVSPEELRQKVSEAMQVIARTYVDPVDDARLTERCIAGMASLDSESTRLSWGHMHAIGSSGKSGVDLELAARGGRVVVRAALLDGPAWRAGIRAQDVLLAIDGQPVSAEKLSEAVEMLRAYGRTEVTLTLSRAGLASPSELRLRRELPRARIWGERLANGTAYLRLASLYGWTSLQIDRVASDIQRQGPVSGLIVDLRDVSAGGLNTTVDVADYLMDSGLILRTAGRDPKSQREYKARPGSKWPGVPVVVLLNRNSGAGADALADALRTHRGAKLMGEPTSGKGGGVQTDVPLSDGTGLRLTTARWVSASGITLEGRGLTPEIALAEAASAAEDPSVDPAVQRAMAELSLR